jgi:voltage-gated potassium channel
VATAEPPSHQTHAFRVLAVALVATFALLPLSRSSELGRSLVSLLVSAILVAVLWAVSRSPHLLVGGLALLVPSALGWWSESLGLSGALAETGIAFSAGYFLLAAAILWPRAFRPRRITEDSLVGSVCVYLLLGLAFACAYLWLGQIDPGAFSVAPPPGGWRLADFAYLSLVTMTTLGYGDIAPVAGGARALAVVQSCVGVLYPAIVVARLVAIHAMGGEAPPLAPPGPWHRQRFRNLLWFLSLLVIIPVAIGDEAGSTSRASLDSLLLVAILYALGGTALVRLAAAPVAGAILLRLWGSLHPGGVAALLATLTELCVFALGLATVSRKALLHRTVNREMLYGSCCVYVLVGVWFASAFALTSRLSAEALSPPGPHTSAELLYFSFMTLTTTGYGDITPASGTSQLFAGIAACVGIFYPAILVGRLVSLADAEALS